MDTNSFILIIQTVHSQAGNVYINMSANFFVIGLHDGFNFIRFREINSTHLYKISKRKLWYSNCMYHLHNIVCTSMKLLSYFACILRCTWLMFQLLVFPDWICDGQVYFSQRANTKLNGSLQLSPAEPCNHQPLHLGMPQAWVLEQLLQVWNSLV